MGRKGDLLELIDGAPVGVTTLTGSVWKWTHHERSQRAFTQLSRGPGGTVGILRFGDASAETSDEHFRVWLALPDRWRFESENHLDLRNGPTRWAGTATHITEMTQDASLLESTEIGPLLMPGSLLMGPLRFGEPTDDVVAGRPCLQVTATLNLDRGTRRFDPVAIRLGGVDHTFWFDEMTGIALRHVGLVDDEPCIITEFKEVRVNPPLTHLDFEFIPPPDAVVERQVDQLIRMAELHGADLTGVDREDPQAVRAALHVRMSRPGRTAPAARLVEQKSRHVPVGEPPADEAVARESIEYAYSHHDEVDESGAVLVNVQSGQGMAGPLNEARKRIPGGGGASAKVVVDDILFLRSDEAVVWFSVEIDGSRLAVVNGREGRAVKVGDRWMIERATIANLIALAGVDVPPPG